MLFPLLSGVWCIHVFFAGRRHNHMCQTLESSIQGHSVRMRIEERFFFPKDVSSQGSSEDCWRISHHTYPTHISHHTYPTHIHHTTHIPHISIQNVSHQYVSHQYNIPPIRIRSTRIPPVRIHAMRIHSKRLHQQVLQYVSHQYVSHQYVSVQHVSHQYVSMLCVSIQCVSIQKVCISRNRKRIPPIRIFNTYPTSTDPFNAYPFQKFASAGMAMSMSIIAYHFIPLLLGGNGNEYRKPCFSFNFFAKLLIEYNCIARV